jgi:hypothetical protein
LIQNSCNSTYPKNTVCFWYIIVNTLHKGDNKDDDNNNNSNIINDDNKNKNNNSNNDKDFLFDLTTEINSLPLN